MPFIFHILSVMYYLW